MFSLTREVPNPYTADDAALATAFAGQAAIVLENARLYANVTRAYEQLGRLDRTKSDFINIASHELRTPLTLLRGYSQILLRDPAIAGNPSLYQMMEGIMSGTSRLHEIIDSMLDVAKIDSGALELHREPLYLYKLMESVATTFKSDLSERQLRLEIEALQELPAIEADTAALRKVFSNLIVNAIKYTPDGGRITLCGRVLPRNRTDLPEGGVEIQVQDTGIGIDPQFHDLIFTKFYQTGEVALHSTGRTKFKGGGPGLGLAIAKGIVEAHGGRVWVESTGYDENACPGSTFFVMLPLRKG
jgi:signal transduction histidine kinase